MSNKLLLLFTTDFYSLQKDLQEDAYHEFYHLVYGMVYYIMKDHPASEDVIQEAFMRAIGKSSQLQDMDKLEGWLKALTRNITFNHLKKFKRNRDELDSNIVLQNREAASSLQPYLPVDQEVEVNMMRQSLIFYLNQLNPRYRQIVVMRWIYGLSYKEIGLEIGLPEGNVRQKLFSARKALRKKMQEEWGVRE